MKYYELTYLLNPNIDETESSIEDLISTIEEHQGEVDSRSEPEKTEVGSSIKPKLGKEKLSEVLLGSIEFYLAPEKANQLREKLTQKRNVLRVMLVSKEESTETEAATETEPQPQTDQESKKVELEDIDQKLDEILEE